MNNIPRQRFSVKPSPDQRQSFGPDKPGQRQPIHLAEGLTAEDKRLFLGAGLRLLYRKLRRNSPISREELAALAAYATDAADEGGVAA
jgi:hypothetical protein